MAHQSDLEQERPRNLIETVTGDDSWRDLGIRIKWTEPSIPSDASVRLGEPMRLRVAVEAKKDISDSEERLEAFCWTNMRFKENTAGLWKDIKLHENPKCRCESPPGTVTHIFHGSLAPARDDSYRLTFNVKWKKFMIWANDFQVDNVLCVTTHPEPQMQIEAPVHFSCGQEIQPDSTRLVTVPVPEVFHEPGRDATSYSYQPASCDATMAEESEPQEEQETHTEAEVACEEQQEQEEPQCIYSNEHQGEPTGANSNTQDLVMLVML